MRKPCPKCFSFVNVKKGECCPVCHYEFEEKKKNTNKKEETFSTSITPDEETSKLSPNLQELYDEANKEDSTKTGVVRWNGI